MNHNKKQEALVVAGGAWQVPIIQYLQARNYHVTVIDPYPTSPGVLIADEHIQADVRDVENIIKLTANHEYQIVTTDQSDVSVHTTAVLAKQLNLRGNEPDVVALYVNKYLSRVYSGQQKIPVPKYFKAYNTKEVQLAIEQIGLPVILKPTDAQSSRGIVKIDNHNSEDLAKAVKLTFEATREDYILVEKFFEGTELTVEGICIDGKHKTLAISQKQHFRTGIASSLEYPAVLPTDIETAIINCNDRYVEQSGLSIGITHAEYLYNKEDNSFCLVEIACRGGGTLISSDIAKWVSGVDLYKILIDGLNGISTEVKAIEPLKRNAVLRFFEFPNGIVDNIEGIDEILKMEGIKTLQLDFKVGDLIQAANDDRSRQGFVIAYANSKNELDNKINLVTNTLKVSIKK